MVTGYNGANGGSSTLISQITKRVRCYTTITNKKECVLGEGDAAAVPRAWRKSLPISARLDAQAHPLDEDDVLGEDRA